jgi:hypothetical protein
LLTPLSDDVMPNTFELSCPPGSVGADNSDWKIAARIHHQCPQLQTLVDRGVAGFGIHVECPKTFYRQWFPQETAEVKLSLPATAVRGRVELLAFCVATSDIDDYQVPGQHADYNNASFRVRAGDYDDAESGWPPILKRFAAEAWRRADASELADEELYPSDAQWSGLYDRMFPHTAEEMERRLALAADYGEPLNV